MALYFQCTLLWNTVSIRRGPLSVRQAVRQISSCKGGIEQTMDLSVVGEAELTDNISTQWGRVSNG
jgi:hypothetical protein